VPSELDRDADLDAANMAELGLRVVGGRRR